MFVSFYLFINLTFEASPVFLPSRQTSRRPREITVLRDFPGFSTRLYLANLFPTISRNDFELGVSSGQRETFRNRATVTFLHIQTERTIAIMKLHFGTLERAPFSPLPSTRPFEVTLISETLRSRMVAFPYFPAIFELLPRCFRVNSLPR